MFKLEAMPNSHLMNPGQVAIYQELIRTKIQLMQQLFEILTADGDL